MSRAIALLLLVAVFAAARVVQPSAVPQTPRPVPPQPTREQLNLRSDQAERAGLTEPFKGITTNGQLETGLFPIRSTGVSTRPVREAGESFLAALTPAERTRYNSPTAPVVEHIHTVVRTPNGNDYGRDLLRQHYAEHPHASSGRSTF